MPRHRSVERHTLRAVAGACALLLAAVVSAAAGEGEAEVVARVNGAPITQGMVNQVVKSLILERGSTPNSDEIRALNDAALDSLIDLELLFAAAQQAQIRVTDQDVQAEIARNKARLGGDKAFAAALQRSGMSQAELAADTRKTLMVDRLIEQRTKDVQITPDAVHRFYDEHREELEHAGLASLDAARPAIEKTLLESERRQRQQTYLDELRKTAKIERPTPAKSATPGR